MPPPNGQRLSNARDVNAGPAGAGDRPRLTLFGKLVILLVVGGSLYGAYVLFTRPAGGRGAGAPQASGTGPSGGTPAAATDPASPVQAGEAVELGIAYGTEKRRWLEWARDEFAKSPDGQRVKVNLIPMGSLEGGQAVLKGDRRIHVWAPASSLYTATFVQEWKVSRPNDPILKQENLALSPMVFVAWQERFAAFESKYRAMNFTTIEKALHESGGWDGIANKPEWGLFKFGHTHPNQSNSGLATLVLLAYDFHNKARGLSMADVLKPEFQQFLRKLEGGVSGMSNSTGNMMKDMVLRGPSSYDALFVYESVAIDYLKNAEGRWGQLQIVYPRYTMWNENPYYVLDVDWSTPASAKRPSGSSRS
jgi:Ca-activated chloride channel family protein